MQLATSNSPAASVVLPHFAFAAVAFFVVSMLLFFSHDALVGHYFHPKLLAITHVAALGWAVMIIWGALYQLLPVLLKVSLFSECLAKVTFGLLAAGVVLLSSSFWFFEVGLLMQVGGSLVFLSFVGFNINLYFTVRKTTDWEIATDFIATSSIWLFLTGLLGLMMVFNFQYPFLKDSHLEYLKLHAHLGIVGWFLLLIIGVASKLFPMFLLAHEVQKKSLNLAYYLINAGLTSFVIYQILIKNSLLLFFVVACISIGIGGFLFYCLQVYKSRLRKELDKPMQHTSIALLLLALPMVLIIFLYTFREVEEKTQLQLILAYGVSIFLGFITGIILGQTFKTLPFIVWLHRYQRLVGKQKTPLPKDLYSNVVLFWQNLSYIIGFVVLTTGILLINSQLLQLGSVLLILNALCYIVNVCKIFIHLIKVEPKKR